MTNATPLLRRFSPALVRLLTFAGAAFVIFVAISVSFVVPERDAGTLLTIAIAAALAVLGLQIAFDVLLRLIGLNTRVFPTSPSRSAPIASAIPIDQTLRVDQLLRLNNQLETVNRDLAEAKDQIERLDLVKTDFITIASHELRTPLAQIRGYTDIIDAFNDAETIDHEKLNGLAANLRKASERMEELIGAMLDTSQLDVNAMDLRYTPAAIESVVRLAIEPLTDAVRERKIMLRAVGLSGLPSVQGDMQRLVQAFRNVIVNAIKFTPDGGRIEIVGTIGEVNADGTPKAVHVQIRDSGVGIASENLELIFHKFYRAYDPVRHSTGAYKFMGAGPGLGLTIARGIIAGHGGRIWAESPGHDMTTPPGSTFHILLPIESALSERRIQSFANETNLLEQPV